MRSLAGSITLSHSVGGLAPSAVREVLKIAEQPDTISFAGGLPAPELFPAAAIAEAYAKVLSDTSSLALQYGTTEGYGPLREWIAARLARRQVRAHASRIVVTSGAQQAIDLVARTLLDPGDVVVTENPTYLAALQVFQAAQARAVAVGSDDHGMLVDELPDVLARQPVRLIYVCADFSNPKGTTLSTERRAKLAEIARRFKVPVLEDDPYGELRYSGETPPAIASFDDDWIIRLGTFSKILAPGLRLGWLHGPAPLVEKVVTLKQAADLHTATLAQHVTARLLKTFDLDAHIATIRKAYGERKDAMLAALEREMPAGTRWTRPDGGLFLWLGLPEGAKDTDVFTAALAQHVAVIPGAGFFVDGSSHGFLRLNYSNRTPADIATGVHRLTESIAAVTEKVTVA